MLCFSGSGKNTWNREFEINPAANGFSVGNDLVFCFLNSLHMPASKIMPCLWIEKDARRAAKYYISIFKKGKIVSYQSFKSSPTGAFDTAEVNIPGLRFQILAAGPMFKFNEAVSFVITCKDQQEVDYFWKALTARGGEEQACGWLKDRYGLSWQVVPVQLQKLLTHKDKARRAYAMQKMLTMKKIIIADLIKPNK